MTEREKAERASTAKQIARSSSNEDELTIDDVAICYKVLTGLDSEEIIHERGSSLNDHPELQRVRIGKVTHRLLCHGVELARLIDEYKDQIVEEDAIRVMSYINGDTMFCPDRADLMSVLSQYGIVLAKAPHDSWKEVMYGGLEWERFFDRDQLGNRIPSLLKRIEREAGRNEKVRKVQYVRFLGSPLVFLLWTDSRNVKFIAYARYDWGKVQPSAYAA